MGDYTDVIQVKQLLQTANISSSTNPSEDEINDLIDSYEDDFDESTGHAWRSKTITNEFQDLDPLLYELGSGLPVHLDHRKVKTFSSATDKLEIWDGAQYVDWIANKTEGRADDFWVDYNQGIVYLNLRTSKYPKGARVTYRYGDSTVPKNIRMAITKMVVADIIMSDDKSMILVDGATGQVPYDARVGMYKKFYKDQVAKYREWRGSR